MSREIWLDSIFSKHWQGRDVFQAARELEGDVYRQLEQRQTLAFTLADKRYFIKKHRGIALAEILKNLLTLRLPVASARNEFTAINAMQAAGVKVPQLAAFACKGVLPAQLESFLVTHDVGEHVSLEDYCRDWHKAKPDFRRKHALLIQVADISRRMHAAGICHRDFYLCHFLFSESTDQLTVIDLHRALVKKSLGARWKIKDLAGLWFSAMGIGLTQRDLLRFVRLYQQQPLREILAGDRTFWSQVRARANRMYRKLGH